MPRDWENLLVVLTGFHEIGVMFHKVTITGKQIPQPGSLLYKVSHYEHIFGFPVGSTSGTTKGIQCMLEIQGD